MFLLLLLPLPGRAGDGGAFRAALQSTQSEITNIVPPPVGSSQGLPSSRPTGTLGDFQLQSQHSDGAGAALPARNIVFKKQSAAREMAGGGQEERCSFVLGRTALRLQQTRSFEGRGKHWQLQITNQCRVTTTAANNERLISLLWQ